MRKSLSPLREAISALERSDSLLISESTEIYFKDIFDHVIATIFMTIIFIAGVYGMNFKYMPELERQWGYFVILCIMLVVALSMIHYFKKTMVLITKDVSKNDCIYQWKCVNF